VRQDKPGLIFVNEPESKWRGRLGFAASEGFAGLAMAVAATGRCHAGNSSR
jgi:hypothetical protein